MVDADQAIECGQQAFGVQELYRMADPDCRGERVDN
jgi:hypothetical protein